MKRYSLEGEAETPFSVPITKGLIYREFPFPGFIQSLSNFKMVSKDSKKYSLIKSYYYACIKTLIRSNKKNDVSYVRESLKVFYKEKYIEWFEYMIGKVLLFLYEYQLISNALFLKINRYFFKKYSTSV